MTLWNRARVFKIFVQLIRNPNRTDLIFKGVEIVSSDPNQEPVKAIEEHILKNTEFQKMYLEKYIPEAPSLDHLKNCPDASFGRAVFDHMNQNGLDFSLWPSYKFERPIQYLSNRVYQDHDLWHALLGFNVSVEDELALQAFSVAQFQSLIAMMLISGGLIHLMTKEPRRAIEAFHKINEAYTLGKKSSFLLSVKLHDLFSRPLVEVRQMCGVA